MTRIAIAGLVLACGSAAVADVTPVMSPKGVRSGARVVGHFYVNMATGEVIASTEPVARPRGQSGLVWIADNDIPCASVNGTGAYTRPIVGIHDDPADVGGVNDDRAYFAYYKNWGDIAADTVIDVLQVSTYADHPDVDADGDGMGDGIEGLAADWVFIEGDPGFNWCGTPVVITDFRLENIPGNLNPGRIEGYMYTVDLVGGFDTDVSFEIGDTDGDPQGAAIHNMLANKFESLDIDADGLVDFSYSIRYMQPGTILDSDGNPIGDPGNRAKTYSALSAPRMDLVPNPPTSHTVLPLSAGCEDAFDVIVSPDGQDDTYIHYGTFWYGGFSCDRDEDGVFEGDLNGSDDNADGVEDNDYRPYSSYFMAMYGPSGTPPCPADLFPAPIGDDQLNFFDISSYLDRFAQADPAADFFPPGGDGVFNFFDVSAFMAAFNVGCP